MTIINSLKDWLESNFTELSALGVDYLGESIGDMVIESIPTAPIVEQYVDGSSLRQFLFAIGSREFYSQDYIQNIENSALYEKLASWCERRNRAGRLPELSEGLTADEIEILSSVYILEDDSAVSNARYQIQCRLTYYQAANYAYEED